MTSSKTKRTFFVGFAMLTILATLSMAQGPKGITYFKSKVNIPFALKNGTKVVSAGEYVLKIQAESGQPVLSFLTKEGDSLLRVRGDRENVPEKERTFDHGGHLRIKTSPDPKDEGQRLIVFVYDFVDARGGVYVRFRFDVPEAQAASN